MGFGSSVSVAMRCWIFAVRDCVARKETYVRVIDSTCNCTRDVTFMCMCACVCACVYFARVSSANYLEEG